VLKVLNIFKVFDQNQKKKRLEARQFAVDTRRANDRQRQQVQRAFNFKHIIKYTKR